MCDGDEGTKILAADTLMDGGGATNLKAVVLLLRPRSMDGAQEGQNYGSGIRQEGNGGMLRGRYQVNRAMAAK